MDGKEWDELETGIVEVLERAIASWLKENDFTISWEDENEFSAIIFTPPPDSVVRYAAQAAAAVLMAFQRGDRMRSDHPAAQPGAPKIDNSASELRPDALPPSQPIKTSPYGMHPDEAAIAYWQKYEKLANANAPTLGMPPTGKRGRESEWVYFRPSAIRRGVRLIHKMAQGSVDIEIAGYGDRIADFKRRYNSLLEPDMQIEPAGKSLAIKISVPQCSVLRPFSESAALDGIRAASRLLNWYKRVLGPTLTT